MSRLVLTQITIKKERSISSTTWYYLLQPSNALAPDPTNYGNPPPTYTDTGYSGWSTTEPTYTVGDDRVLYIMVQTLYSDNTFSYATPTISSSYEAAKDAYNEALQAEADIEDLQELGLHHGYIWYNSTARPATGNIPVYPVGSYIASGINNTINQTNSNTYGLNTWISTGGINLRYNAIDLAKLTTSTLEFYYPSTSSRGTAAISLGTHSGVNSLIFYGFGSTDKQMELTATALNFYGSSQSTADAILNSNGLKLVKGGIEAGTYSSSSTNFIYLSTEDYNGSPTITINGNNSDWRQIIGNKFGVKNDGTLYASNVDITGVIKATSGIIGNNATNKITIGSDTTNASIYSGSHNTLSSTTDGFYIGADGISIGSKFNYTKNTGVLTLDNITATNFTFNSGVISSGVTIGSGGTSLSTIENNAQQSHIYNIGYNGTIGIHFLGILTLSAQTAEVEIEIHTGAGQNNRVDQNLTIKVNIKRGWQGGSDIADDTCAGVTVRYEGDPTIVTMGESKFKIYVTCINRSTGIFNVYMETDEAYADGWYQVKGRNYTWVHDGTTPATMTGTQITRIVSMNPYTVATTYITNINSAGIYISPANQSPTSGAAGNSIKLDGSGLEVFRNNQSVAFYGSNTRIGLEQDSSRLIITDSTIQGIDRYNNAYFDITHMGAESPYLITEVINEHLLNSGNIDLTLSELWANIEDDEIFYIIIEYYKQDTSGTIVEYYDTTEETHIKGETDLWSDTYSTYNSTYPNQITITSAYPSILSEGYTLAYKKITLGRIQQVKRPIYRFGEQVAETGGANSFLMGRGTVASGANTLAIGQYNRDNNGYNVDGSSYFIVGGGTNDEHRKNLFEIYKYEPFVRIDETPLQTWVMTGEDWGNEGNGTDGYYRIWENGIVEYWQSYKTTLTHYTTTPFNWYGYYCDFTFPDIFKDPPCITYNVTIGSGFAIPAGILQLTRQSARLFAIGSASGSQTVTFYMHIVGRYGTSE